MTRRLLVLLATLVGAGTVFATPALADHSWGDYHWARTSNPFTIKVIDSSTSDWDSYLDKAISDWNASSVMDVTRGGLS